MPISYRIDLRQNVIQTTVTGALTDNEILEHKKKLVQDPDFRPGMKELSDVRNIERLDVTPEGVRCFVAQDAYDASRLRDYKLAIVVSKLEVFGMARMYEMMTEKNLPYVMVFRDINEAMVWLGIEEQE